MKLTSITANRHLFQGSVIGRPLRFLLTFDNGQSLRLGLAGDGQRMLVDSLPLDQPFEMGEAGNVVVEDMTQSLDTRLQGAEVDEARGLNLDGQYIGVQLLLSGGNAFHFWGDGDEMFWGDEAALAAHPWSDGLAPRRAGPVIV